MIDAAICDGDFVVVREQHTAENGDIVAALLDDEATVKSRCGATAAILSWISGPTHRVSSFRAR